MLAHPLAIHYRHFRVAERLLLTGHSHQAWPDCARDAVLEAWDWAANAVDDKWELAFSKAERIGRGYAAWMDDRSGSYTPGPNVHTLVFRLLTALDYRARPRIVTTDGEFHSVRRQLDRLEEEGVEIVRVPAAPASTVGERIARAIDDRTMAAICSAVFFQTAEVAGGLDAAMRQCERFGAAFIVDAYHALGVMPYSLSARGLEGAYVLGGGYKYLQLGEGCCVLRSPADCALRPVYSGWFAEFGTLSDAQAAGGVPYAEGAARFMGATYDPTSHFRGARVFDFFEEKGLSPAVLQCRYRAQVGRIRARFLAMDADPTLLRLVPTDPCAELGGFVAFESPRAGALCDGLRSRGVSSDFRGRVLRLGPAPYLSDAQIDAAMGHLGQVIAGA